MIPALKILCENNFFNQTLAHFSWSLLLYFNKKLFIQVQLVKNDKNLFLRYF